jgi:hypothetical protein
MKCSSQRFLLLRLKYLAFATTLMSAIVGQSVWAACIGSYCDIDHNTYGSPAACATACVAGGGGGGGTTTPSYSVIKKTDGTGNGTISEATVPPDYAGQTARVTLTAVPDAMSRFVSWSNNFAPECTGTTTEVIVTLNAIKTCIATFEAVPTPGFGCSLCALTNGVLNFGNTAVTIGSFTISETGNADLIISKAVISGDNAADFTITSPKFPFTIPNGAAAQSVSVECKIGNGGIHTATLELSTNDAEFPTVQYALNCDTTGITIGTPLTVPAAKYSSTPEVNQWIDLGKTTVGQALTTTISVSEQGNAALAVNLSNWYSPTPNNFKILSSLPLNIADGGAAQSIQVQCTPSTEGLQVAVLQLTTNDPYQTTASYTFTCTGTTQTTGQSTNPSINLIDTTTVSGTGTHKTPMVNGYVNDPTSNSDQTATNLTIGTQGSVAGGILAGTIINQGVVSNVMIAENAVLTGGKLSGFSTNHGTVQDTNISQYSQIQGGNYRGNITNQGTLINPMVAPTTQIINTNGVLQNPLLLPGSQVVGGKLTGTVIALGTLEGVTFAADAKVITQVKDIPAEIFQQFTAQTLAFMPKTVLSQLTPAQFAQIPVNALHSLNANNMGGLSPAVIDSMTHEQIQALDSEAFKQMPEDGVAKFLTNFNAEAITLPEAKLLLPPQWTMDNKGNLTAPAGTQITFRSLKTTVSEAIILPYMSDLSSSFAVSGKGNNPILPKLNQLGETANFTVSQQKSGILSADVAGSSSTSPKSKFAFMTDPNHLFILDENALRGLQLNEQGQYILVTEDGQQIPIIPMTQNPEGLLTVLGRDGTVTIQPTGEVLLKHVIATRRRDGAEVYQVVMFDPFIEPAPEGICNENGCDWSKVDASLQPGLRSARNLRAKAAAKVIYPDGTAQKLYPTVLFPEILVEEAKKIKEVENPIFRMDGTFAMTYQGSKLLFVAEFDTQVQPIPVGQAVKASLTLTDKVLLYQVPYQGQLLTTKLLAEIPTS